MPDPKYRGTGGPIFVQPAPDPNPIAPAMVAGARSIGIPSFETNNGRMMEGDGGASICDLLVRDEKRQSVFRSYAYPYMDRDNLTVLTHALVTRLTLEGKRASGVEFLYEGKVQHVTRRIGNCAIVGIDTHTETIDAIGNRRSERASTPGNTSRGASSRCWAELSGSLRCQLHLGVSAIASAKK